MQRAAVAFEDVALYFSAEEWALLARWQRELYQEVMMDNYDLVACLDSLDIKPLNVHGTDPGETSNGGDRGRLDPAGSAPWDKDAPGDAIQGHRVPLEPGCPPLHPEWEEREPAGAVGPQICRVCGQSFEDEAAPSTHRSEHGDPTPGHECVACGKVFRHRRNLLVHKKQRGQRRHSCGECGRSFCLKGDLLRHRHRRDPQERGEWRPARRQCPECGRHREDELSPSRHRARHGEERPFACGRCERRFSWKESLQLHLRSHAPERRHKCQQCGRAFSRGSNLLLHQRVHTGERPYACAQCDKTFSSKASLTTHRRLHRRRGTFVCALCRLGFGSKSKLRLHLRGHGDGGGLGVGSGQP
ncbi:zinc finger protein 239-like isoform X1 [Lagopus muta]|uniref:zinc finger protein 239-like isoform X1 n=2 Tax=Lagopus muta TaxID=64668 RepID=UPI00209D75DE|nr:zinc finger protein 239-like isoform X1 [Lagopus muta]